MFQILSKKLESLPNVVMKLYFVGSCQTWTVFSLLAKKDCRLQSTTATGGARGLAGAMAPSNITSNFL
jgi:hypothetical protein